MRKKGIIIFALSVSLLTSAIGVTAANVNPWNLFTKEKSLLGFKNGVIFQKPGNKQKKEVIDSIDPITDKPSKKLSNQAPGLIKKEIRMNLDGNDIDLSFDYVKRNGKVILLPLPDHEPGAGYQLFNFPSSTLGLIEFEGSLYIVDVEKGKIDKILKDSVDGYSLEEAKKKSKMARKDGEDPFVWWGSRPSINPNATKMAFYTNRSGKSEIWIKDLTTGEEFSLLKSALIITDWINDNEFIAKSFDELIKVNVSSGEVISYGVASSVAVKYPYLIAQKELSKLHMKDLVSNSEVVYQYDGLGRVIHIETMENNESVALINQPDTTKSQYNLFVINVNNHSTKIIDIPAGLIPSSLNWQDEGILLLTVHDLKTYEDETIIVELEKM